MTAVTFVGANAGVSGNNVSLTPTIHASAAAGDLMLLFATIRNGVVVTPTGWSMVFTDDNVALFSKEHSGTESSPTVTFTGGAAGDDTLAQVGVFRTLSPYRRSFTGIFNGSAQNIAIPSPVTPARANSLVMYFGWKQDDWTSVGAVGANRVGTVVSTAGNDAAMVWDYTIQTTPAATPAGSFGVTGGLAAVSAAYIVVMDQAPILSVSEQEAYPPRTLVTVANLVAGDSVEVWRTGYGTSMPLRAGSTSSVVDPAFLVVDAELPFGVPVSYAAFVNGFRFDTSAVSYVLTGGKVALSDAITDTSAEVVILAWPEKPYDRRASQFRVGGRNVVVSGDLAGASTAVELYVDATSSVENVLALLQGATEGVVQVRQPGGYDGVDSYWSVLTVTVRRWSPDGTDPRRIIALQVLEVEGWAPTLEAAGFTYEDLEALYTGLTYADLEGDYATYLLLAQADLSL